MNIGLRIEDSRAHMLNPALPGGYGLASLDGFFRFWHWERRFSDPQPFKDCFFYDLHLDPPATPSDALRDPALFERCFPLILKRLVGESNILTLFVKSLDPGYFDEFDVIRTLLAPRNLRYVLLPDPIAPGSLFPQHCPWAVSPISTFNQTLRAESASCYRVSSSAFDWALTSTVSQS